MDKNHKMSIAIVQTHNECPSLDTNSMHRCSKQNVRVFFRCYSAQLSSFVLLYNFLNNFNNTRDTITDTNPTDVNDILHLNISISHQKCRKENFNNIVTKQFISREREREINEGMHVPIESILCC